MNVKEKLFSVSRGLERKDFFVSTIVCGISSLLIQVTVVPGVTVACSGWNVKLSIVIVTVCPVAKAGLTGKSGATTHKPAIRSACGLLIFEIVGMKKLLAWGNTGVSRSAACR